MSGPVYDFPTDPTRRFFGLGVVGARQCSPNTDPDTGGPRVLPDGTGSISSQKIKRMIRDYAHIVLGQALYIAHGVDLKEVQLRVGGKKRAGRKNNLLRAFWDNRVFGATFTQCEAVVGPIQIECRSWDTIEILHEALTRVAGSKDDPASGEADKGRLRGSMGTRNVVWHGLYTPFIMYSHHRGAKARTTAEDLTNFWVSFIESWEDDLAANRLGVELRKLYAISWSADRADFKRRDFRKRLSITPNVLNPKRFEDYTVEFDSSPEGLPEGFQFHQWDG